MKNAVAFANNDIAIIAWSFGARPDGCMGFAIYRIDDKNTETALPSHAVFPNETIQPGQTTEEYPVQKFYWKDPYARLIGDQTKNYSFRYKIVPLEGKPGSLTPMKSLPFITTNEVTLTSEISPALSATFNRGLISTQHISQALKGHVSAPELLANIVKPGNQIRMDLTGDTLPTLLTFMQRAKQSGQIFAALYELTDVELIAGLAGLKSRLNIIMANIPGKIPQGGGAAGPPENDAAWNELKDSQTAFYRLPADGHIVHNKFLVYVGDNGPEAVLTGSTNWTDTGLCAQTNNVLVIEDANVAARYLAYWKALMADEKTHEANGPFQGPPLRAFDSKGVDFTLDAKTAESALTSYFSPNTPKQRAKTTAATPSVEAQPVDMEDLEKRVMGAKEAVLFLAFIPGKPSITTYAAQAQRENKDLFVRGCVTSPDASGDFATTLQGSSPPKSMNDVTTKVAVNEDPRVIAAKALTKADAPAGWLNELLKVGFAITHDKIVVIDPFSDDCVVVTGSHNLGYQASYNNDENLVMIKGNKKLAQAYATHVLDVYDHFAWRWSLAKEDATQTVDSYLKTDPDSWLQWYYDEKGNMKNEQLKFWLHADAS